MYICGIIYLANNSFCSFGGKMVKSFWGILIFAILSVSSVACDIGDRKEVDTEVTAKVADVTNQRFSPSGAAVGYLLGGKNRLAWGVAGGVVGAKGCQVSVVVDDSKVVTIDSPDSYCNDLKVGSEVLVHKVVSTRTYSDKTTSIFKYYRW
jgi:hypothetical protein